MVGFGPPASRQARREWWRRQIRRQTEGNLTVAEFCRRLGVSTVTFYAWKRRFREAAPASPRVREGPSARPMHEANGASTPAFLPVSIRDAGAAGHLEIELANACIVRLKGAVDPQLLRIAIRAAGQLGGDRRGGE
jgi:transposase-like protein